MNKTLVLLSASFPYGNSETFLETEINYLSKGFEKVIIISSNIASQNKREIPQNCEVLRLNIEHSKSLRFKSMCNIFHHLIKKEKEIISLAYKKKFTNDILKTMLISLERGKRVAKFLEQQNFDYSNTVFYSYWCDDTALGLALLHEKNKNVKAVSRMHRWDIYFEESKINYLPFRQFITNNLNKIISISQDGIEYVESNWKVARNKFILSRLGINNRVKLEIKQTTDFKLVSCSNIIPVKRVELIADALNLIHDKQIEWTHFGDGVQMRHLELRIKNLKENIKVHLKGRIPNTEIYQAYQEIKPHLFINVSSSEGVPVSIMEAMSFGIPVLATNVGGTSEIVNTKNGYLLSENPTPKEIAKQIERFIEMSSEEYQIYCDNAYKTWEEKYNAEKNYGEFVEVLALM